MVRTRTLGCIGAAMVSAIALAGCGGSGNASGVISANYMQSGTYDKAAAGIQNAFEKKSGVKLKLYSYPWATLLSNNNNAAISGKCTYNVVSGSYYLAPLYPQMESLNGYADKSGYAKQLIPGLWDASEFFKGKHIGVPYGPDAYAPLYRKDLFQQAGLPAPTSFDDLLAALPVLKQKFGSQGIAPISFGGAATDQLSHLLLFNYDSYLIDSKGHYAVDPAAAEKALDYSAKLLSYAPSKVSGISTEAADAAFLNGKAAVLLEWPSFVQVAGNAADSPIKGKWSVMKLPDGGFSYLSLWNMFMNSCTKDKSAAWKWMTTFSSPATDKTLFTKYGVNPAFQSTYDDASLAQKYPDYLPATRANLAKAKNPPWTSQAQDVFNKSIAPLLTGSATPAQVVATMNEKLAPLKVPDVLMQTAKRNGLVEQ